MTSTRLTPVNTVAVGAGPWVLGGVAAGVAPAVVRLRRWATRRWVLRPRAFWLRRIRASNMRCRLAGGRGLRHLLPGLGDRAELGGRGVVRGPRVIRALVLRQLETALRLLAGLLLALQLLDLLLLLLLALFYARTAGGGEVVIAFRWLLAAPLRQLDRGLHRVAVVLRAVQVLAREDFLNLARGDAFEDGRQVRAAQRLLLEELLRQGVQVVPVLTQDLVGNVLGLVHEHADVLVHQRGDLLGGVELATAAAADEWVALLLAELHRTHTRAHAVLDDHGLGDLRGHLDVRARAGGRVAEDQLLGGTPTHGEDEASEELGAVVHALVVFRGGHCVSTGAAAGQDGDLVDPLDVLHRPRGQGVAALVVGGDLLLVLGDDLR